MEQWIVRAAWRIGLQSLLVLGSSVALGLVAPSVVAAAEPVQRRPPEQHSAVVSLADLDLTTAAGIESARQRLHDKAVTLCSRFYDERRVDAWANFTACTHEALAAAMRRVEATARLARTTDPKRMVDD